MHGNLGNGCLKGCQMKRIKAIFIIKRDAEEFSIGEPAIPVSSLP
jgi:hypothetical protein